MMWSSPTMYRADVTFETSREVTLSQRLAMTRAKTAALTECACTLGAVCGGADVERGLEEFGMHLVMALQLVDDLLDNWGDPEITGKPTGSDIRRCKMSLPVVAALTSGTEPGARLTRLYQPIAEAFTDEQITQAVRPIEQTGARTLALHEIEHELHLATTCLNTAMPDPDCAATLTALLTLIIDRIPAARPNRRPSHDLEIAIPPLETCDDLPLLIKRHRSSPSSSPATRGES
ncbi:polyprenyl synthetase family protein [Nocardia sp. NPDC052566]|uniref:polyprenyl synthetase family protein n=1 Tax=Nocardia sp. NPDC052566 TaxID=3364330 RepID=UPI0037CA9E5B